MLRQRRKYQKLYDSTILLQALFRGKLQRWRYLRDTRDKARHQGATIIQCLVRAYFARKRVYYMRLRRNKALAATTIQKIIRGRLATKRVQIMLKDRRFGQAATKIQCFIRGHLARKNMARILIELAHFKYAVRIQAVIRGAICRIHISKKIAEMQVSYWAALVVVLWVVNCVWACPCNCFLSTLHGASETHCATVRGVRLVCLRGRLLQRFLIGVYSDVRSVVPMRCWFGATLSIALRHNHAFQRAHFLNLSSPLFRPVGVPRPPRQGGHHYPISLPRIPLLSALQDDDAQGQQGQERAGSRSYRYWAHHSRLHLQVCVLAVSVVCVWTV